MYSCTVCSTKVLILRRKKTIFLHRIRLERRPLRRPLLHCDAHRLLEKCFVQDDIRDMQQPGEPDVGKHCKSVVKVVVETIFIIGLCTLSTIFLTVCTNLLLLLVRYICWEDFLRLFWYTLFECLALVEIHCKTVSGWPPLTTLTASPNPEVVERAPEITARRESMPRTDQSDRKVKYTVILYVQG